jgi:predicted DNA binding CopG/RHH family protein
MKKDRKLFIRFTEAELRLIEDRALQNRMPVSTYVRKVIGDTLALPIVKPEKPIAARAY